MSTPPIFEPLQYQRSGSGAPLVLVHGYLGGSAMWGDQIDFFENHFDVIAVDLPGFGKSGRLKSHDSIESTSAHILEFLTGLGVDQFQLLGHSMGGMIVQQMALDAPGRIVKLICYGTGPVGVLPGRFETIDRSRERLMTDGLKATARRIAATWFADGEQACGFLLCERVGQMASLKAALDGLTAWENWNVKDRLSDITCPALIVWGEHDKSYDFSQPTALKEGIPNSQLKIVPNCAHNVHMEMPTKFNEIVERFLLA